MNMKYLIVDDRWSGVREQTVGEAWDPTRGRRQLPSSERGVAHTTRIATNQQASNMQ